MWNVSGISGAAPVWIEIMTRLHRGGGRNAEANASPPAGLVSSVIPGEPERREWFIRGTESVVSPGGVKAPARIVYPANAAIIAIDPNIPAEDQKLFFEARKDEGEFNWKLDGEILGGVGGLMLWTPTPGRHSLALTDAADRTLDEVNFEIRGAQVQ